MNAKQTENDAIARLRAANPVSAERLRAGLGAEEMRGALAAALALAESPPQPVPAGEAAANGFRMPGRRLPAGRRATALLAALACAAAVALIALLVGGPGGHGQPEFAAAAIEVAEANPRLLVTAPGWAVTDAGEFEADEGEVTFSDGSHRFTINWYPARLYRDYLRDRAQVSPPQASTLLGHTATTVDYGRDEYATMLSPWGGVFLETRGALGSRAAYDELLGSLRPVGVDEWLGAMPPSVVGPADRAAVVASMLRGVPLPPGFDTAALQGEGSLLDRYQLAVKVAGAVGCGWVESWLAAEAASDASAVGAAVAAMAGSSSWPLMTTIRSGGGWAGNVAMIARQLERGRLDRGAAGSLVNPDGSGYEEGPAWALALGCRSHYWRRPLQGQG